MFDRSYVKELEDLIMDELLPMYLAGCRSSGRTANMNDILVRLMRAKTARKETPWLLKNTLKT